MLLKPNTYLGKLCALNHAFEQTQKSLRYKSNSACLECVKLKPKNHKKESKGSISDLFYLGKLCPRNHDYQGTKLSLRYKSNFDCKECADLLRRARENSRVRIFPNKNSPRPEGVLIPSNHYLGLLCKYGHDYMQTGYSLRNSSRCCVVCNSIRSKGTKAKERIKRWKKENPDYMPKYLGSYYQANKQRILQKSREYEKTPKGKACKKISRHKRRARMAAVTRVPYTASELVTHFHLFSDECIYCGSKDNLTADHVIPIAKGGHDSLDNILPCCFSCNSSKQDKNYLEWYSRSPHFDIQRLAKVAEFIGDERVYEP